MSTACQADLHVCGAHAIEATGRAVLVVEDEPLLRASLVGVLTSLGSVDVIDAVNLTDARKLIRAYRPRLLLADLDLRDGSGVELAAGLDRAGRRIPIIFASATLGDYRDRLPQRPGITFLEKPIAFERLRPLVEGHLADGTGLASLASSPFGVADYIQLAGMGRRSVVIDVRSRSAAAGGRIVIRGGEVWSAHDELGVGIDAFRRLAFQGDVQVSCSSLFPGAIGERTIEGRCESMLLEAARQLDEASRAPAANLATAASTGALTPEAGVESGGTLIPGAGLESGTRPTAKNLTLRYAEIYERGVEALLSRDYRAAYEAFAQARRIDSTDARVAVNLARLEQLGYGK